MAFPTDDLLDRDRLAVSELIATVEYHASLPSTQDRAHDLARQNNSARLPLLIVAEEQTAGRGRGATAGGRRAAAWPSACCSTRPIGACRGAADAAITRRRRGDHRHGRAARGPAPDRLALAE